jgi:RHS repeat-associated protein
MVTDNTGAVVARFDYDAWGNLLASSFDNVPGGVPYGFVGALGVRFDAATGLYYMRHRWYDPSLQRFLSRDPIGHSDLYLYAGNNPVNLVDPIGLVPSGPEPAPPREPDGSYYVEYRDNNWALWVRITCLCPEGFSPLWNEPPNTDTNRGRGRLEMVSLAEVKRRGLTQKVLQNRKDYYVPPIQQLIDLKSVFQATCWCLNTCDRKTTVQGHAEILRHPDDFHRTLDAKFFRPDPSHPVT